MSLIDLAAVIQGLVGGSAVVLVWEAFLKPAREKRSLANMLKEEVGHNLQYAIGQRLRHDRNPAEFPADFRMSTITFDAVAARLGELSEHVGPIHLLYRRLDLLNRSAEQWPTLRAKYEHACREGDLAGAQLENNRLVAFLQTFRSELDAVAIECHSLLPRLWLDSLTHFELSKRRAVSALPSLAALRERSETDLKRLDRGPAA